MTVSRQMTFDEYLSLELDLPGRCEFIEGELVELPPESGLNDAIANYLFLLLVNAGMPFQLVRPGKCEIEVPVLKPKQPRNRYPDLVILKPEHIELVQKRLTIRYDMPAPALVVEVVSPGDKNIKRDYQDKLQQYERRGIPEYWLIDPKQQAILVFKLQLDKYVEVGTFRDQDLIVSDVLPIKLSVEQILAGMS